MLGADEGYGWQGCGCRCGHLSRGGGRSVALVVGSHLRLDLLDTCASLWSRLTQQGSHRAVEGRA